METASYLTIPYEALSSSFLPWSGFWIRDFDKGHTLEAVQLKYTTHEVNREHIRFFDTHKEYAIEL